MEKLGEKLKVYREKINKSQADFANILGISRELLSNIENDKAPVTAKTKRLLIEKFNFSIDKEIHNTEDDNVAYFTKNNKVKVDSMELMGHSIIEIKAMLRMILRTNGELLAVSRGESVTKTLSEISKGVEDEISIGFSELQRKS